MRPDLNDILSGVQRLLQNDFVPALAAEPFLAEQAMYATLILEYCKKAWPRVHLALAEEHGDLRATLGTASAHLAQVDDAGRTLATALQRELASATVDVPSTTLDLLAECNGRLRGAVSQVVDFLDAQPEIPADAPLGAARAAVDAYLRRDAVRQRRELDLLGLSW